TPIGDNSAADWGGGVAVYGGAFTLTNSLVSFNTSDEGGGLYLNGGTAGCTGASASASYGFLKNTASAASNPGGGVKVTGGTFTGVDCDFGTSAAGTDNSPEDIRANSAYTKGDDADVVCTSASCI